jgi:hypothetical protein
MSRTASTSAGLPLELDARWSSSGPTPVMLVAGIDGTSGGPSHQCDRTIARPSAETPPARFPRAQGLIPGAKLFVRQLRIRAGRGGDQLVEQDLLVCGHS